MKILHSFWSKPYFFNKNYKNIGGWRQNRFFYMSWALSCLTLNKIYGNISLVTDRQGYDILIKNLDLPYSNITIELDNLNKYPANLWALGKIAAYSLQRDAFIHVDGDVYIWDRFGSRIENATLIAQSKDIDEGHYEYAIKEIHKNNYILPKLITNRLSSESKIVAANAGIFGGNDLDFFDEYCEHAFKLIEANQKIKNSDLNGTSYALIYEQYLFSCMAHKKGIKIEYLVSDTPNHTNYVKDISNFSNKYESSLKYVHLLSTKKRYMDSCYELQNQLELEFPEYMDKIERICHKI
ncbi:DUF6734 family protein [Aquimarina algiphila]|uniref:DUF6734 domain-containing protein n=1 Tax=Aquimarina algiphila TaxID=2047982 RepID=A0A554VI07_9FLAO|nr:DUF6734 family protein [Aquimarina algiphila]TSE07184.1 hypothetical protein FOF46_16825 [Aquimarina algiphila]